MIDLFYLANGEFFGRSDKKSFLSAICISLATLRTEYFTIFWDPGRSLSIWSICSLWRTENSLSDNSSKWVTPCKFDDSADSFYSANIISIRKILCSIRHIVLYIRKLHIINDIDPCKFVDSARRTNTFIHDVASRFHPKIASYYSDGDRLHFRRHKQEQYSVKINTEDKRRETCMYSYVYLTL